MFSETIIFLQFDVFTLLEMQMFVKVVVNNVMITILFILEALKRTSVKKSEILLKFVKNKKKTNTLFRILITLKSFENKTCLMKKSILSN